MRGRTCTVLAGATLLAAPVPWLLESAALDAIAARVGQCDDGSWGCGGIRSLSLDAGGLRLSTAWMEKRGMNVSASAVEVRPTWSGIEVHIDGLAFARAPKRVKATTQGAPASGNAEPPPAPRIDTRGIPVHIVAVGTQTLRRGSVELNVRDPVMEIGADGAVRATFSADVEGHGLWAGSRGRLRARPRSGWGVWSVGGEVVVADGTPLHLAATVSRRHVDVELEGDDTGSVRIEAHPGRRRATIEANGFRPAALGTLAAGKVGGLSYDLRDAMFDGAVTASRGSGWTLEIPTAIVSGAVIEHRKLARDPVAVSSLLAAGRVHFVDTHSFEGELAIEHDGVAMRAAAARDGERLTINAELPRVSCQALLDAVPDGIAGVLRGERVEGEIEGGLQLEVRFAELPSWQKRLEADPEAPGPPPGVLDVSFPFLESCRVAADPPDIDFEGLRGPYRHDFVDGTGRRRTRVMAPGADGFVPLSQVELIAGAFVTLEDSWYSQHDGFDRTQMANAVWHNFQVGRISRGASTISQQTARNLFLGVDRSLARKLQEAALTARLEDELSKRRILELYVNVIELGPGVHGVEEAAQFHFGKPARSLNVVQSLHLAMLAPAPHRYSERFASGTVDAAWAAELREHIRRLYRHRVITVEQMREAYSERLDLLNRAG